MTDQYFGYDAMGRLKHWASAGPSEVTIASHSVDAMYDLAGNLTDLTYPDGSTLTQRFDGAGRLARVSAGTTAKSGAPYISSIIYNADGTPQGISYGPGVTETITENSRLQPCHFVATGVGTTLMDREYFHTPTSGGDACAPQSGNNGNIWQIVDNLPQGQYSQNFRYDGLNRLHSFFAPNMSGAVRGQTFDYDSFGNMRATAGYSTAVPSNVGTPQARMFSNPGYDPSLWPYDTNNRLIASAFDCSGPGGTGPYDAAGNIQCGGSNAELNAQQYTWDAESRLISVGVQHNGNTYDPTALYSYDASGDRIRSDQFSPGSTTATSWREYTFFNGQMLAEKDQNGNWTDYIYANGEKVAKVASTDPHLHLQGHANATTDWVAYDVPIPSSYTVQPGDQLLVRQYQMPGSVGGVNAVAQDGTSLAFTVSDQDGYLINEDSTSGYWHARQISLNGIAGKPLGHVYVTGDQSNTGDWSADFEDIAIVSANGNVLPLYNGRTLSLSYCCSSGMSNYQQSTVSALEPGTTGHTSYYLAATWGPRRWSSVRAAGRCGRVSLLPSGRSWTATRPPCATSSPAKNETQNQDSTTSGPGTTPAPWGGS